MFSITYSQARAIVLLAACVTPVTQETLDTCDIGAKTLNSLNRGGLIKYVWCECDGKPYHHKVCIVTPWGETVAKHIKGIMDAGIIFYGAGGAENYDQKYFKQAENA